MIALTDPLGPRVSVDVPVTDDPLDNPASRDVSVTPDGKYALVRRDGRARSASSPSPTASASR